MSIVLLQLFKIQHNIMDLSFFQGAYYIAFEFDRNRDWNLSLGM